VKTAGLLSLPLWGHTPSRVLQSTDDLTADYDGRRRLAETSPLSEAKIDCLGDIDGQDKIEREEKENKCLKPI
jgi:hypothetical protein